jgi:hypothetical protein
MEQYSADRKDHLSSGILEPDQIPGKLKKRAKKPINCTVTIHDRTQIETIFDYYLFRGAENEDAEFISYRVDAFFFYPDQFGLSPTSYPKEKFYNDIRPLIRFKEPKLRYKRIAGQKTDKKSPINYLRDYHDLLQQGKMTEPVRHALDEVHLFACTFISTFFKSVDRTKAKIEKISRNADFLADVVLIDELFGKIGLFLQRADDALTEFRKLVPMYANVPEGFSSTIYRELRLIDEYCYYRLRDGIALIIEAVESMRLPTSFPSVDLFFSQTNALISGQDKYAEENRFILITEKTPLTEKERYLHRRSELKRRIWKVLFVEIRNKPLFAFQRQFGAMVAAGLAAVWAVMAQIILVRQVMVTEHAVDIWGVSGLLFLIAGVFAYVIKDRIKEIGRSYFRGGLFQEVPDQSETIFYRDSSGKQTPIGSIKENARFEDITKLPKELLEVRHLHDLENSECEEEDKLVLHYKKNITLTKKIKILGRYPLRAVHDILRVDIEECLSKLGEPVRSIKHLGPQMKLQDIHLPKVYHLDIGLIYSRLDEKMKPTETSYEYFRLVVNKDGLLRIDTLS